MDRVKVFLSFKNNDRNGKKAKDAFLAEELYAELHKRGINAFYSNQTIKQLGESHYKMAIDEALDEAIVLIAIGTSKENLNSNWVNYEWDSFYGDILSGRKNGQVISYIADMEVADLPRTLRRCQSFKKGENSIEEICDFVCNYLKNNDAEDEALDVKSARIVDLSELFSHGITALDVEKAFAKNECILYKDMPSEIAGTPEQWADIIKNHPDLTAVVTDKSDRIYGNYSLMGLSPEEEKLMAHGQLIDTNLSAELEEDLYSPGQHTGYLLNLSVNPSSESAELYNALWDHLIDTLKQFALNRMVFFSKIYYKAFLPEHEAKIVARGFRLCCKDSLYGKVYVHEMDPDSTLYALDSELADIYAKQKKKTKKPETKSHQDMTALTAYMGFWKQIEELFYQPEYIRLKKYFMGGKGLPKNTFEYKLALAVAEFIRDCLQYSESLLPFVPEDQQYTHRQYKETIYNSEIIKESMNIYQFTTEDPDSEEVNIEGHSIMSLITFANIWLDIDRIFMIPDLLDFKKYFYESKDELPPDEEMETCEALTVRILSVFKISERQIKQLPLEYVESYYNYKDMIWSSALTRRVIEKYPFIKKEFLR